MSAPAVVIVLRLEEPAVVAIDCLDDAEEARLRDWVNAHPAFVALIARALAAKRERAA